jgi:hypothetical protein
MGCVYFIKHRGMDPIKIGMSNSNNPYDRLKDFETTSPFGIELLGFIKTDEPDKLEKKYHSEFSSSHIKGEWYSIPLEKINSILGYHNNTKITLEISNLMKELDISPREVLNHIKTMKKMKLYSKAGVPKKEFEEIYFHLRESTDSIWVPKRKMFKEYVKRFKYSQASTYNRFRKIQNIFSTRKEGRTVFITLKEEE